jgi:hypothetical protein
VRSTFFRMLGAPDKELPLQAAIAAVNRVAPHDGVSRLSAGSFRPIPGAPFSYWVGPDVREAFTRYPSFENNRRYVRVGLQTSDDPRFVRSWWETGANGSWHPLLKGGGLSPFHSNIDCVISWYREGAEIKAYAETTPGTNHWSRKITSTEEYFREGVSWAVRARRFAPHVVPAGCIFSVSRYEAFVPAERYWSLLGLMNSAIATALLRTCSERFEHPKFISGIVAALPVPEHAELPGTLALRAWSLKRSLDTVTETSHAFQLPALIQVPGVTLAVRATAWSAHVSQVEAELATIQAEVDDIAFDLYGIDGEDRARIEAEAGTTPAVAADEAATTEGGEDTEATEESDEDDDTPTADTATLATELFSWSIGVAFGRFDLRHATGELQPPVEPGPFDPLPARSPGMCPDDTLAVDFLVDDPGHALDLSTRVAEVFAQVFPADHEARLDEAVRLAGAADLPTFLRRTFFPFHLKRYSKSRRKAPIWWPLSTASGGYTVWLAWPRLTRDALFRVADELKRQKLPFEARKLTSLKQDAGPNPSTREKAVIAGQEDFVSELSALLEEVERVAPLWNPVLDDGVILHFALLWRVVRDAAWQKECRAAWEKLTKGDYDWAHIAMHLWPERVAPKCRIDRSLAIAHGLEDAFWVEVAGKWQARADTDAPLAAAIAERSSPAVKAALRSLESAPAPSRGGRVRRGR